jgi:hypothetical protein
VLDVIPFAGYVQVQSSFRETSSIHAEKGSEVDKKSRKGHEWRQSIANGMGTGLDTESQGKFYTINRSSPFE